MGRQSPWRKPGTGTRRARCGATPAGPPAGRLSVAGRRDGPVLLLSQLWKPAGVRNLRVCFSFKLTLRKTLSYGLVANYGNLILLDSFDII